MKIRNKQTGEVREVSEQELSQYGIITPKMKDGGIHINPKNKGKFNALKKRTGKSTEELTHSKNPLTRKRAIFAQNAKKWKHEDGGNILPYHNPQENVFPYSRPQLLEGGAFIDIVNDENIFPYIRPQMQLGGVNMNAVLNTPFIGSRMGGEINVFPYSRPQLQTGGNVFPYSRPQLQDGGEGDPLDLAYEEAGRQSDRRNTAGFYDKHGNFTYRNPNKPIDPMAKPFGNGMSAKRSDRIATRSLKNMDGVYDESGNRLPNSDGNNSGYMDYESNGFGSTDTATGKYLEQSATGFSDAMSATSKEGAIKGAYVGIKNLPKGIIEEMGNLNTTAFTRNYENNLQFNQLNGTMRKPYATYTPERINGDMAHPLQNKMGGRIGKYQTGGKAVDETTLIPSILPYNAMMPDDINSFKSDRQDMNAEVEGGGKGKEGEILKVGDLVGPITGDKHAETGKPAKGVPVRVPRGTKVLTNHLKYQFKNGGKLTAYAKEGKKFSTEDFAVTLKDKHADPLSKKSAQLATNMNNAGFEQLYALQEQNKLKGLHGKSVQNKAMQEMMEQQNSEQEVQQANVGGFISKFQKGGIHRGDKIATWPKPLPGTPYYKGTQDKSATWNAMTDYNSLEEYAKAVGYNGPINHKNEKATITAIQQDVMKRYPDLVNEIHSDVNWQMPNAGRPDDGYLGGRWQAIANRIKATPTTPTSQTFEIPGTDTSEGHISDQQPGGDAFDQISGGNYRRRGAYGIPVPFMHGYALDPLHTRQVSPEHINYRPVEIERAINDANQQVSATQRFLPVGSQGIGNINNAFSNAWKNKSGVYGDDFNRRQSGMQAVDEFNVNQDSLADRTNLAEFTQFRDLQARRGGAESTQELMDNATGMGNYYKARQYGQSSDYINSTFNPLGYNNTEFVPGAKYSFSGNGNSKDNNTEYTYDGNGKKIKSTTTYKKLGGKVKSLLKKRKK